MSYWFGMVLIFGGGGWRETQTGRAPFISPILDDFNTLPPNCFCMTRSSVRVHVCACVRSVHVQKAGCERELERARWVCAPVQGTSGSPVSDERSFDRLVSAIHIKKQLL